MSNLLAHLNDKQQEAVTNQSRFLHINAGPGTGKTTTLAAKILYAQTENSVPVDQILGISFSRSAKTQLINKFDEFTSILGYGGKPLILTFHGLAYRIIQYGIYNHESIFGKGITRIPTEEFRDLDPSLLKGLCTIYKDDDATNFALSQAYNRARQGHKFEGSPSYHWVEIENDATFNITSYEHGRLIVKGKDLKTFWKRVHSIEKRYNTTDFQGMITEAVRLLKAQGNTYKMFSDEFKYVFVDEYQDTSLAQEDLLFSLLNEEHHVTVVGDKNQTIYTFNGSNNENMERFLVKAQKIDRTNLNTINLTQNYRSTPEILNVTNHFVQEEHQVYTLKEVKNNLPVVVETHKVELAASYIGNEIEDLIKRQDVKPSEICVLYRKNSVHSPQALSVIQELEKRDISYTNTFAQSSKQQESIESQILSIQEEYQSEPLDEVIKELSKANDDLLAFIKEAMNQGAYDADDLLSYIVELDDEQADEENDNDDAIILRTVHNAKGLEFPYIFILYLGDREFPHSSQPDIEEERRLLYVGLTRAEQQLYVIGQKGIHFESFLDSCLKTNVQHVLYHSSKQEELHTKFKQEEKNLIDSTTVQLKQKEEKDQEEFDELMNLFDD